MTSPPRYPKVSATAFDLHFSSRVTTVNNVSRAGRVTALNGAKCGIEHNQHRERSGGRQTDEAEGYDDGQDREGNRLSGPPHPSSRA